AVSNSAKPLASILGLQLGIVLFHERADVIGHREQLRPLLLVQGHGKAAQPVYRYAALLAHAEARGAIASALELFVLGTQPVELSLHVFVAHSACLSRRTKIRKS